MIRILLTILLVLGTLIFPLDIFAIPCFVFLCFLFIIKIKEKIEYKKIFIYGIIPILLLVTTFSLYYQYIDEKYHLFLLNFPLIYLFIHTYLFYKNKKMNIYMFLNLILINIIILGTIFEFKFLNINTVLLCQTFFISIVSIIILKEVLKSEYLKDKIFYINYVVNLIFHIMFSLIFPFVYKENLSLYKTELDKYNFECNNQILNNCDILETIIKGENLFNNLDYNIFLNYSFSFVMQVVFLQLFINYSIIIHKKIKKG